MDKKEEKTSEEKAYEFWFDIIKENDPEKYYAGVEWMISYWQKKLNKIIDETDKCYLEYDEDGYLTCSYCHKAGAKCLMIGEHYPKDEDYEWMK